MWTGKGWSLYLCLQKLDKKNPQTYTKYFTERTVQELCLLWERRKKKWCRIITCARVLSPAMILCAALPLSPSTAQHWPVRQWKLSALGYCSLLPWFSALNSSSILHSSKAEIGMHTQHTPIIWKQYIFLHKHGWYLLYLEITSKDFAFQEEEINLAGKASVVVTTVRIKCSPGVKICKYINSALCFPLWEKSCYLYNTIKAYVQPCL